jgi:hypothetical protein
MRSGKTLPAVSTVIALLLIYIPFRAAAQASVETQTVTIYTLICALAGCVAVLAAYERRPPAPAALVAVGTLFGALAAWMIAARAPAETAQALRTRVIVVAPFYATGIWMLVVSLRRLVPDARRPAALAAVLLVAITVLGPRLVAVSSLPANNLVEYAVKPAILYWTVGSALVVFPVLALTTVPGDWFERWWDAASSRVMAPSNPAFATGLVVVAITLAGAFSWYCFGAGPINSDEISQLWHARILLGGRLALPADPNPEFFAIDNVIDSPVWMSQFPIGGPAVQALGVAVGAAWLTNPIFTGLTSLNVYRFVQRVYGEAQARAAAIVFVASPTVLIMGGSHMNHVATAWLLTLAFAALPVWMSSEERRARMRSAALIGLGVGTAAAIRPLDAAIAAAILGGVMLFFAARDRARATSLLVSGGVGALPVALLLAANWLTTGAPQRFGYTLLWGPNHSLGLHADPTGLPHTAWRALLMALRYVTEVNAFTTTWAIPLLLIVALAFALGPHVRGWDKLLLAFAALQLTAYAFYFHDGQFAGARFLFSVIPAILILATRAPFMLAARELGAWRRATLLLLPVCIATTWVRPMGPFGVRGLALEFRGARVSLKRGAPRDSVMDRLPRSLVFVQEHASARLVRRLWALGVSRSDAARLMRDADNCALFDALRAEERRGAVDSAGRVQRMELHTMRYNSPAGQASLDSAAKAGFTSAISGCVTEMAHDNRVADFISYGPMLLRNRFDAQGRIDGQVVYVMDLSERNEVLRSRFGDRQWYRWEIPRGSRDSVPKLVPYDSAR